MMSNTKSPSRLPQPNSRAVNREDALKMLAAMKEQVSKQADELTKSNRQLEAKMRRAVFKSMLPVSTRNLNGRPSSAPPAPRGGRLASTATHSAPSAAAAAALSSEGTRVAEAEVDERWAGVVLNTNVMQFVGWRALGRFRTVSKGWNAELNSEHHWKLISQAFAAEKGLYCPRKNPALCWKRMFHDQLWVARTKWGNLTTAGAESGVAAPAEKPKKKQDFAVTVATRFRPGRTSSRPKFFLPLHQRLKLLKKGEKLTFDAGAEGLDGETVKQLVGQGEQLSPDMIRALLDAKRLEQAAFKAANAAEKKKRGGGHWKSGRTNGDSSDSEYDNEDDAGNYAPTGDEDAGAFDVHQHGGGGGGAGAGRARKAGNGSGDGEDDEDPAVPQVFEKRSRRGGTAKVMAVDDSRVVMYVPGQGIRPFTFEQVIGPEGTQSNVYEKAAQPSIISALNGFNACLFVYGQTGSGKTHTIFGPDGTLEKVSETETGAKLPAESGMVLRALQEILTAMDCESLGDGVKASISAQYIQIYQESLTDLLTGGPVKLRGGSAGFQLQGAVTTPIETFGDAVHLLNIGEANKRYAATTMNNHSSRAHTIFILNISQLRNQELVTSHLHIVDLAGCEQLKQSGATGTRKKEAIGINSSLMVLKKVIGALVDGDHHVPYYESKLTQLLKGALGGASRTTAIITGAMDDAFAAQTLQALRFGESVARIINSAAMAGLSVQSALGQLDSSLQVARGTLQSLESRGKTQSEVFTKAVAMVASLQRKRDDLVALQAQ